MNAGASSSGSGGKPSPRTERSTSSRGSVARPPGNSTPAAASTWAGALSPRMCSSSRSPTLGLIGTTAAPAASAPTTAAQVSSVGVAHTATLAPTSWSAIAAATPASSR